jgi:SNF2 family DNA or RNA helicase
MREKDYLNLPPLMYDDITVKLDGKAQQDYRRFERDAVLHIDEKTLLTANNAAALSGKLLQLCNGAVYGEEHEVVEVHSCKIEALLELVEQLGGEHAVICYNYKHDLDRILTAFSRAKLNKKVAVYQGDDEATAWNNGEIDLLLVQPVSCAYGLNLQEDGRHLIWFGLTFDAEVYLQMIKRLHRQGQKYPVFVHHLIVEGGRDEDAIASINGKEKTQSYLLDSLIVRIQNIKEGAIVA